MKMKFSEFVELLEETAKHVVYNVHSGKLLGTFPSTKEAHDFVENRGLNVDDVAVTTLARFKTLKIKQESTEKSDTKVITESVKFDTPLKVYGKTFKTAVFNSAKEANAFLDKDGNDDEYGVIHFDKETNKVYIAALSDKGK